MKSVIYKYILGNSVQSAMSEKLVPIRKNRNGGIFVEFVKTHCTGNYSVKCLGFNANGLQYIGTVTNWSKDNFVYQVLSNTEYIKYKPVFDLLLEVQKNNRITPEIGVKMQSFLY